MGSFFTATDYLLVLPITLLALFALGTLLIDLWVPPERKWVNAVIAFVGVLFSLVGVIKIQLWMHDVGLPLHRGVPGISNTIYVDRFVLYFFYLFLAGAGLAILMSVRYL